MPTILKSRKVQMAIVGLIVELVVFYLPELEGGRTILGAFVLAIVAGLMGAHTLTDIAAIKAGANK